MLIIISRNVFKRPVHWSRLKNMRLISPFPKRQILDSSNIKEFADDISKFYENGREFSKRVENAVGKEEIARKEQFLHFPQCLKKKKKNMYCGHVKTRACLGKG